MSRGLLYAALALVLGTRLWLSLCPPLLAMLNPMRGVIAALAFAGLGLALNALALQAAYPFGTDNMPYFADAASYRQVLQGSFGLTWALFGGLLLLAIAGLRRPWAWACAAGMALCLSANSHAGESGRLSWTLLVDALHVGLGLAWLGGVLVLAWLRLGGTAVLGLAQIKAWSRIALPLFLSVLALGGVRLLLALRAEGELNALYGGMLALKVLAVLGVMLQAQQLRRMLRRSRFVWRQFDDRLSLELFAAFILILLTALLTQLRPN